MEAPLSARAALLQALVLPGYGVELMGRVRRATGGRMDMGEGSVYPALRRLERDGLVRSRLVRAGHGAGRPRRYYELTLRGIVARDTDRRAIAGLIRPGGHLSPSEPAERIGERLRRCAQVSAAAVDLRRGVMAAESRG